MKPIRSLSGTWGTLPRERRTALVSLMLLVVMLGTLVAYQRFMLERSPAPQAAANTGTNAAPPQTAEAKPVAGPEPAPTVDLVGKMVRPLAGVHRVVKQFGSVDQTFGDIRLFSGLAYEAHAGESVQAAAGGVVAEILESDPLQGVVVEVDHGGGILTRYAGLGKVLVSKGGKVQAGSVIGQVGTPGPAHQTLGTHLEFEVIKNGQPENPTEYLPAE